MFHCDLASVTVRPRRGVLYFLSLLIWTSLSAAGAQPAHIPHPQEVFGFPPGADHQLAGYEPMREYYRRLDESSERIQVIEIGPTAEGRQMILAVISSESNMERLRQLREISEKLARARVEPQEARRLAGEGKAVVWIDGGLHATEVAHAQHSPLLAYRVVTEESPEMAFIRDNVILLQVPVMNPDGLDLVVNWYQKHLGTPFETSPLPELYQKYSGHDNNRDWYMITQPETRNVSRILYEQWYPQIVYNHHQSPPFPARIFVPPFAEPMNPKIPPLVIRSVDLVGSAISARLEAEGKTGVISRIQYTTWWNGGMRTAPYFHNMVGILTETALHRYATPRQYEESRLPKHFRGGLPTLEASADYPNPWRGGWWRLQDAVDYMMTASLAVLDIAARHREQWLQNIYRMGRSAIEKGRNEAPFAYLVSMDQHDPSAAVELLSALRRGGIDIYQARREFVVEGKRYSEGTFVVYTAQPFRPYILDLMEPQNYPDRRQYPGGPPLRPYDISGWTLPLQMGVQVDRAAKSFIAPVRAAGTIQTPEPPRPQEAELYLIDRRWNSSYRLVNDLLSREQIVRISTTEIHQPDKVFPPGAFLVVRPDRSVLADLSLRHRTPVYPLNGLQVESSPLHLPRLGLYKSWVANSDEGWARWVLEQYAFPYETIVDADVRAGDLGDRWDVIILPSQPVGRMMSGHAPGSIPPEYAGGLGIEGLLQLKRFVESGGLLIALDQAAELPIDFFNFPVRNILKDTPEADFFCPGSLLRLEVDVRHPLGFGMPKQAAAFFVNSLAFDLSDEDSTQTPGDEGPVEEAGVRNVATYGREDLLLSGWILGEEKIQGKAAVTEAKLGQGQVVLVGFRPHFRGQPHGTFKLLFNAIYLGGMKPQ